ncbi:translation initiation factor IF-2-like [Oppia nitens]|uniref:translation initiation factor IF-2-like n=1 Tax=Oppia nitens TaxID=1686743 RepID=UPI0023DBC958|nr:translation initiation factor IF-2-like [Oppia nitens]
MLSSIRLLICIVLSGCCYSCHAQAQNQYQYLGVKHAKQMEAPSLESGAGSMGGGGGGGAQNYGSPDDSEDHGAAPGSGNQLFPDENTDPITGKKCNKEGEENGWREMPNMPRMRSLAGPENDQTNCVNPRALEPPTVTPNIKMIDRKKEESDCKIVKRVHLTPTDIKTMEKDLKTNRKEYIETYTESYVVTSIKTIFKTRRRLFMQKRKIVNQKMIEPVVIIRRKVVNERQLFERIVPKVIETREIIHKPAVKSKIVEGPIFEIYAPAPRSLGPACPEVEFDANNNGQPANYYQPPPPPPPPPQPQPQPPPADCPSPQPPPEDCPSEQPQQYAAQPQQYAAQPQQFAAQPQQYAAQPQPQQYAAQPQQYAAQPQAQQQS